MYSIIVTITLLSLALTEAYCITWLCDYVCERMAQKEAERREVYRRKAYAEMYRRLAIEKSRQELWDSVTK